MSINDPTQNGMFHQIPKDMKESPLLFAISTVPEVRKSEQRLLEKQRQAKMDRQKLMRQKKLLAARKSHADSLTFINMHHSPACWCTEADAQTQCQKLSSETSQREAVKQQIRTRVDGFGWKDL